MQLGSLPAIEICPGMSIMKLFNQFRKTTPKTRPEHKFLFVLCPPFCGSTLLTELLETSAATSLNHTKGNKEGQKLPTVKPLMFDTTERWNPNHDFDWKAIKKEWLKAWDLEKSILVEKSPPNLLRVSSIMKHFDPAFFLICYRNPYAHCEGLIRRKNYTPEDAAKFTLKCLMVQKKNIESLNEGQSLVISYEELTGHIESTVRKMGDFLPDLSDIRYDMEFSAKNVRQEKMGIENLNEEKIANLTNDQIIAINEVLRDQAEILAYFGYDLIER